MDAPTVKRRTYTPQYLHKILEKKLINVILNTFREAKGKLQHETVKQLRGVYQQLPVTTLNALLCEAFAYIENFSLGGYLVLAEVLLSPEIEYFSLKSLQNYHIELILLQLLQILIQRTKRLNFLSLPLMRIPYNERVNVVPLLCELVAQNDTLTHLSLPGLGEDELLRIVAKNCYQLLLLNLTKSAKVTDLGVCYLTDDPDESYQNDDATKKPLMSGDSSESEKLNETSSTMKLSKSKVCATLRFVYLKETSVTARGIIQLLTLVDNLEDVQMNLDEVLDELADFDKRRLETWKLKFVELNDFTIERLLVLMALRTTSTSRLSLTARKIPQPEFNNYLLETGKNLTFLELKLSSNSSAINISFFLKNCSNLESLSVHILPDGKLESLFWGDDETPVKETKLKSAHLNGNVVPKTALLFLQSTPFLNTCYFKNIIGDDNTILSFRNEPLSKYLTLFLVSNIQFFKNPKNVSRFWSCHQNIKSIGYVDYTISDLGLGSDVALQLLRKLQK